MPNSPGRRWYEREGGCEAAAHIRTVACEALHAIQEENPLRAAELLEMWEQRLDIEALSAEAYYSIRFALSDAGRAITEGRTEDARAFIHAAKSMLGPD